MKLWKTFPPAPSLFSSLVFLAFGTLASMVFVQRLVRWFGKASSPKTISRFASSPPAATAHAKSLTIAKEPKQHSAKPSCAFDAKESSSQSNFHEIFTSHLSFDFTVDFDRKVLVGVVDYTICHRFANAPCSQLVLDCRDLTIKSCLVKNVSLGSKFVPTKFSLSSPVHPVFGSALSVDLMNPHTTTVVRVCFETSPSSSALQWLNPNQTSGKRQPFLFSQCQAIHARSFFPCQDAPSVKFTYDAQISVRAPMVALMSAVMAQDPLSNDKLHTYSFKQQVPIPSYLVALVVGELESREISFRSRIWSEPSMVDVAQREFALDTERFLSCAEELCGEYVWGRYDLLLLPPSFPYGGMENPCLVFLTPTLLAGDRSLVNVVAHEIGHCWFGNLVTNDSFADFWCNEGFTVFTERRILSKLYGEQRSGLKAQLGRRHWMEDMALLGPEHEFTKLHINMENVDPDDSFSSIPYEKGCAFLLHLERLVGGPLQFEPFLRAYVSKFRFGFINSNTFRTFFHSSFPHLVVEDWEEWVYSPGVPSGLEIPPNNVLVEMSETFAVEWVEKGVVPASLAAAAPTWSCDQIVVFLDKVLELQPSPSVVEDMDALLLMSRTHNCEIRFKYNTLLLRTGLDYEDTVEFLGEQGRMKYCRPLYRELFRVQPQVALDTFARNKDFYHSICQKMIARDLNL